MSESQFAQAVLALVRVASAVAMIDLYRRLRKPSIAPLSLGMALYAAQALVELFAPTDGYVSLVFLLQSTALTLLVCGIVGHFVRVSGRTVVAATVSVGAVSLLTTAFVGPRQPIHDVVFLIAIVGLAASLAWQRKPFRRVAGNSVAWGFAIFAVAAIMYTLRLTGAAGDYADVADDLLNITVSVAIGLYLLNLEFNASHIERGRSEESYRTLFDAAGDSIFVSDLTGQILDANRVAAERLGYSIRQLRKLNLNQIDDEQNAAEITDRMSRIHDEGRVVFETTHLRRDGTGMPVEVSAVPFEWQGTPAILGIVRDLTERKRNEQLILRMAYYDPLTGLANRTLFDDRLSMALAQSHRSGEGLALLFIDVDHFKTVNDTLGHPAGDELLVAIGQRLADLVREGDTVARFGGDEYTLLLPQIATEEAAAAVAWKVLDALEAPIAVGDEQQIHTSASIGIAMRTSGEQTAEELVRNADIAMFRAKERGRNTYEFYDPEMNVIAVQRFELKNDLRRALERGELELYYQPQVRCTDQWIVGAEALLRWPTDSRQAVSPAEFVPLAEESGLIVPLGEWVLEEACRTAKELHDAGYSDVRMSVNISARQLVGDDLFDFVRELLRECEVAPSCLELEITEGIAMQHPTGFAEAFRRIGDLGVRVAIDDFGTGHSSLDRLKRLPIHTLKIARPFVEDLSETDEDAEAIVFAMIVLGRSMGLNVIAEGVETKEQLEILRSLGCDEMQGFLFSPAVEKDAFVEMLHDQATA